MNSTRRALLQSLGMMGPAYFLPSLRKSAFGQTSSTPPKRLIVIQTLQGWLRHHWDPTGTETDFQLGPITSPLEPFKSKLTFLNGLGVGRWDQYKDMPGGTSDGHISGGVHTLTAAPPGNAGMASGPSIDQFIAQEINKPNPLTMLPSFTLGVDGQNINGSSLEFERFPFYTGANQRIAVSVDSMVAYRRLFPNGQTTPGMPMTDPRVLRKRSVLDFVAKEFSTVQSRLGRDARQKLDAHGSAIRSLENALALSPVASNTCVKFDNTVGLRGGYTTAQNYEAEVEIRLRLIQTALACDLTRVVSFVMGNPPPDMWGWRTGLAGAENPHDLAHKLPDSYTGEGVNEWVRMQTIYHRQLLRLLQLLDEIKESDGKSILDHSAVLWTNQIANGDHNWLGHRWILAGSLGGYFRTGRHIVFTGQPDYTAAWSGGGARSRSMGDLHTSLANGMGIDIAKFGDPLAGKGAITELRV